jgi:hypothetical protein
MRKPLILLALMLVTFALTSFTPAQASTTYDFVATHKPSYPTAGDFSLQYVDVDGDARFSLNELVPGSFSHVRFESSPTHWAVYGTLYNVPSYSAVDSPYTDGSNTWMFSDLLAWEGDVWAMANCSSSIYTYTQAAAAVPLPASVLLLGSGLAGLGAVGWRRRKASGLTEIAGLPGKSNSGFSGS